MLGWPWLPLLTVETEGGISAQPQTARWVRLAWNVGDTNTWIAHIHMDVLTTCIKTPLQTEWGRQFSILFFFFFCENSHYWPVEVHTGTKTPTLTEYWLRHPLSTSVSVAYFYFSSTSPATGESLTWRSPPLICRPVTAWQTTGTFAFYKEAALLYPYFPTTHLSLSHISFSRSISSNKSLICHRPVSLFLCARWDAHQRTRACELLDRVNTGAVACMWFRLISVYMSNHKIKGQKLSKHPQMPCFFI